MEEFKILDGYEYIQLNQLLKMLGLVDTGGEANQRILNGEVLVNDAVEIQKRKKLRPGSISPNPYQIVIAYVILMR